MADKWFAECLPCKWEERHDSQFGAIEAVTQHVLDLHRDVRPEERAHRKMGHVQLRTEEPPRAEPEPQQEYFQQSPEPPPEAQPEQSEPAAETTADETEAKPKRHWGKKPEVY